MNYENIVSHSKAFDQINALAREKLIFELARRNQYNLPLTDFSYMNRNQQGYMTHYFDDDECVIVQVSFRWTNKEDQSGNLQVSWNPNDPIVEFR